MRTLDRSRRSPAAKPTPDPAKRVAGSAGTDLNDVPRVEDDLTVAHRLAEGFTAAMRRAVLEAHAEGLAIPARMDGIAVEVRPNGEVAPIDDRSPWSPADWKKSTKH